MSERLDYDEESLRDKVKRGAGLLTLVGSGLLSVLHTLSHVVPAVGVVGLSLGENYKPLHDFFSKEYMQVAYLPFVVLSFCYMYRDHKHHKHEKDLRKKIHEMERLLEETRGNK
mgnify:CR=1 FL=1